MAININLNQELDNPDSNQEYEHYYPIHDDNSECEVLSGKISFQIRNDLARGLIDLLRANIFVGTCDHNVGLVLAGLGILCGEQSCAP